MHVLLRETPELPSNTIVWLTKERREWLGGRFVNTQWDMEEFEERPEEIVERVADCSREVLVDQFSSTLSCSYDRDYEGIMVCWRLKYYSMAHWDSFHLS
jgi:hypothetical protein